MNFEVLLIQTETLIYDVSELVTPVDFTDNINVSCICTFGMLATDIKPEVGNGVKITCEGVTYFSGNIFKLSFSHTGEVKVTAYDQLRHLKANDTFVFKNNETASQIVTALCGAMELRMGVIEDTKYGLGTKIHARYDCRLCHKDTGGQKANIFYKGQRRKGRIPQYSKLSFRFAY